MQLCVTGGNGFIGRHLVDALARGGHSVRVLTRKEGNPFPAGVEVVRGDLASPECPLDTFLEGCQVLFHCAGEVRDVKAMCALHVDGTKRLIKSALGRKLHWVQLSSVGAYGPPVGKLSKDRMVTEDTATRPANEYEITKTLADELVMQAGKEHAMRYTIVRPSNVFGAKMTNQSLRIFIKMMKRRMFFYVGKSGAVMTFVHVDDVVAALMACAAVPSANGQIYNLSSDCLLEDLVSYVARQLKLPQPWLRIPEPLISVPMGIVERLLKGRVHLPKIDILVLRTRYPTHKIESELGFVFAKPMPGAIADLMGP